MNRLLVPYLAEAVRLLEAGRYMYYDATYCMSACIQGVASPRDIDIAMKLGAGEWSCSL